MPLTAAPPSATAPFNINGLHDDEVVRQLRTGENAQALAAYFGEAEYRELRRLAQLEATREVRGGQRVLILPGIMGSKIGRPGRLVDDVLWLDPVDVMAGKLLTLALPDGRNLKALGVLLFGYLKLKLNLRIAGFDAAFHAYDWRLSLDILGKELSERLLRERNGSVMLVAHSMGGLVSRAAMSLPGGRKISRLIQLGTPNSGSFAPVQALRATYPTVRKIAALDLHHSPEQLAERVFRTLPGLYQMLPAVQGHASINFFDRRSWPRDVLAPDAGLLKQAREVRARLAPADERCRLIVGVHQETVTQARRRKDLFEYTLTLDGDGTVPRTLAEWPGCRTWYVEENHGGLTNNATVGSAVIDLLHSGDTRRLVRKHEARRTAVGRITDAALRNRVTGKVQWNELSLDARRKILEPVISPEFHEAPGTRPPGGTIPAAPRLIDSRLRRRTIELRLARGSITEAQAHALVLGVFRGVEPGGAAAAIDRRIGGAVKEFTLRRMFSGHRGEVFVLPTGHSSLPAHLVLLAGLGDFDQFDDDAQQFVAENVIRTFVRTQVDDFASVVLGAGSGVSVATALRNQLTGYFRGLKESDTGHRLRRITIVEFDQARCDAIRAALAELSLTPLFDDIDVLFDEIALPTLVAGADSSATTRRRADQRFAYLIVSQAGGGPGTHIRAAVLTSGAKAAVLTGTKSLARTRVERHLRRIGQPGFTASRLRSFGEELGDLLLAPDVQAALAKVRTHHLVVVHDQLASAFPWETLAIEGRFPAAEAGLSRRYAAENMAVARWSEARKEDATLDVLLVVNPTEDLDGAAEEGDRLQVLLKKERGVRVVELRGAAATRDRLIDALRSGRHDVVHYCGHAFFDPAQPGRSGLVCAGNRVLSGADLNQITELPALAFFNACEAGRIRGRQRSRRTTSDRLRTNVSLAEALLRGGIANYVGTFWPVGDRSASDFARTFYRALVRGEPLGRALQLARNVVRRSGSIDWADYIHYGNYDFAIKRHKPADPRVLE